MFATRDDLTVDFGCGGQRFDPPGIKGCSDLLGLLLALQRSDPCRMPQLRQALARDIDQPVDGAVGPTCAGCANDERAPCIPRRFDQSLPFLLGRGPRVF